ncbi:MAG TPA: ribonuclease T2 [Pseudolabrys sp.]|jgi:ribonuclease T2|nr:ribonuclease T2 [Pseudolabrys sp.]
MAAIAASFTFLFAVVALAQEREQAQANAPGRFDFYVLALSWSPSYCAATHERSPNRRPDPQCAGRPFSFVVHGLWPQYDHGYPSDCQRPAPRIARAIVDSMLDLMPSPRLVYHEWDRHGTCSGLAAQPYFDLVRKARAAVKIPPDYLVLDAPATVAPDDVAEAFVKANPGLSRQTIAVVCSSKRISEVRICLTKDLGFRDCGEVAKNSCRRDKLAMPAVRAGGG